MRISLVISTGSVILLSAIWVVYRRRRKYQVVVKIFPPSELPKDIIGLNQITQALSDGTRALQLAPHVQSIEVHSPELGYFPPLACALVNLIRLDLSGCTITFLPFGMDSLTMLRILSMAKNRLNCLPPEIGLLTSLKNVDFSNNLLTNLPKEICCLTQLEVLNLMGNLLASLPRDIGNLRNLRLLGLKGNILESLPPSFSSLVALKELFITGNVLTQLPEGFSQLSSLVKLQASFNSLESIPEELGELPNLELMRVAVCNITCLPTAISGSSDVNATSTDPPPSPSSRWGNLAWLSLGGNPACAAMLSPRPGLLNMSKTELCLGAKLGDGASGEVFKALILSNAGKSGYGENEVAVKFFHADMSPDGRTAEEVAIACAVDHPNLTRVLATVPSQPAKEEGALAVAALVMDICHGRPMASKPTSAHLLRCRWDPEDTFSSAFAIKVALGVSSALRYLHSLCICHGDVYAHNILVGQDGMATLCDFGASFAYECQPHQRSFFEAMEVRALGLFLQDLSAQVRFVGARFNLPNETHQGEAAQCQLETLRSVSKWCICTVPGARPSFSEVVSSLSSGTD